MKDTKIEWATHTFNPWWGCEKVSPGCAHCYAEAFAKRTGHPVWGSGSERRLFGDKHWNEPLRWNADGGRVFCASMADVFEDHPAVGAERHRLWDLIAATPRLTWLLLTKRPENVLDMVPVRWLDGFPRNVWLGTTVEDQERADMRLPHLLGAPAPVRFVSYEPALGPVYFGGALRHGLDWIIVGGESGPGSRAFDPRWAEDAIRQGSASGAAVFVKQLGARPLGMKLKDRKGGDWDEWPEELRVREFPS